MTRRAVGRVSPGTLERAARGMPGVRGRSVALFVALLLTVAGMLPGQIYARTEKSPFPHDKHAKLFPTCAACHGGVTIGDAAAVMPPPSLCVECHDGTTSRRVVYNAPTPRQDFLRYEHRRHAAAVDSSGRECASCHASRAGAPWMAVQRATPESCQSCHTHRATTHLDADNRCATCHIPIATSRTITVGHLASLPRPPSHEAPRFAQKHDPGSGNGVAQCATCHTRESCALCHVNATDVAAINQLLPDARVASLLRGRVATYVTPDDHRDDSWASAHGRSAVAASQRCAACHAQPSCTVCHSGSLGRDAIRRLPSGVAGAPGVKLTLAPSGSVAAYVAAPYARPAARAGRQPTAQPASQPAVVSAAHVSGGRARTVSAPDTGRTAVRPHPPGFERQHAASAASGRLTCEGCHTQRYCAECHAGETKRNFHAANFVTRHAPESYGRDLECASCHNTEVFCRACHQSQGIASSGQQAGAYHNAQPLWLLQHGQAARRGLQSCTTCHAQRDCMQCHSQRGWGVSPHGQDFDAGRLGARARVMCARCHLTDPTRGR